MMTVESVEISSDPAWREATKPMHPVALISSYDQRSDDDDPDPPPAAPAARWPRVFPEL